MAGVVFSVWVLIACRGSWQLLRQQRLDAAVLGAGFLGLAVVALQVDFPVVTLAPATLILSLLLAFVSTLRARDEQARD